jgi:hypothetical protein
VNDDLDHTAIVEILARLDRIADELRRIGDLLQLLGDIGSEMIGPRR